MGGNKNDRQNFFYMYFAEMNTLPIEIVRHIVFQVDDAVAYKRLLLSSRMFRSCLSENDTRDIGKRLCVFVERGIYKGIENYTAVRCKTLIPRIHTYSKDPPGCVRHGQYTYYNSETGYRVSGVYNRGVMLGTWKIWHNWSVNLLLREIVCNPDRVEIKEYDEYTGKFVATRSTLYSVCCSQLYEALYPWEYKLWTEDVEPFDFLVTEGVWKILDRGNGVCKGITMRKKRCKNRVWCSDFCNLHRK